jgi:hypothetical protein
LEKTLNPDKTLMTYFVPLCLSDRDAKNFNLTIVIFFLFLKKINIMKIKGILFIFIAIIALSSCKEETVKFEEPEKAMYFHGFINNREKRSSKIRMAIASAQMTVVPLYKTVKHCILFPRFFRVIQIIT